MSMLGPRRIATSLGLVTLGLTVACSSMNHAQSSGGSGGSGGASTGATSAAGAGGPGGSSQGQPDAAAPAHGPVKGLLKVGTAEYTTGLLMDDGRILMASGQPTPVLTSLNFPSGLSFKDYAGGLHQSVFVDKNGRAWTWGDTNNGLQGSGMNGGDATMPYMILVDSMGADFSGVSLAAAGYQYNGVVKNDGSVWVWGDCTKGISGDGTKGGIFTKPTKVPLPAGVSIKKLVFSNIALALAADGSVWSWGADGSYNIYDILGRDTMSGLTPGQVKNLPPDIVDIAAGAGFSYALAKDGKLYGWGIGKKLGDANDFTLPPANVDKFISLPKPVKFVAANDHTTHVVLTDGSLWGWGDDAMGEVGDGQGIDFGTVGPHSSGQYAWDWGQDEIPVYQAKHIAPEVTDFKAVFTNTAFVFYVFAVTEDGHLYSWGRNKTGDLMNGIVPAAPLYGNIGATYPNSWDVHVPTNVNPLELTENVQVTSPYCLTHPTGVPCNQFNNATGKAIYQK